MPTLTGRQRLSALAERFGPRQALEKLLSPWGLQPDPGGATPGGPGPGSSSDALKGAVSLPAWITDQRATMIIDHFLHGTLLLPWDAAPWWQPQVVPKGWPMLGVELSATATPAFGTPPHGGVPGASMPAPADSPGVPKPGAALTPTTLADVPQPVAPHLWDELTDLWGGSAWLWAKYQPYFRVKAGKSALLTGVLRPSEVAQGTISMPGLPKAGGDGPAQAVDCFAYTLAVAIGTLEQADFGTEHNVAPTGYPSQWQAPEPPISIWRSPLHGDNRFWHEFDAPPVGQPDRYVRHGLTRQEAVRVWARRVAVCLWADANEHWGRWPWRLEATTVAMRRRLLGWDPLDPRLLSEMTNPEPPSVTAASYGFQNTGTAGPNFPGPAERYDAFGQAMWPRTTPPGKGRRAFTPTYRGYAIWDTNPYLAWSFAWHTSPASTGGAPAAAVGQALPIDLAVHWITAVFQTMGMWHGRGWLAATPLGVSKFEPEYAGKSTPATYAAYEASKPDRACSLAEVLDLNMGGCHTNGMVALSLMRSQCVPAVPSRDAFFGFGAATGADAVDGTSGEARFVRPSSIKADGQNSVTGHVTLLAGFDGEQRVLQHSDRMLADRLGVFANPRRVWVPFAEHMLCLAWLGNSNSYMKHTVQLVMAAHEARRTREAIANASKSWQLRRGLAEQYDKSRAASITPFATSRLAWFLAAERTLATDLIRSFKAGPWLEQAQDLLDAPTPGAKGGEALEAFGSSAAAQALAARLLGIDSRSIWGLYSGVVQQFPTVHEQAVLAKYVAAAPWPANFQFTGSVGQQPYNYETAESRSSDEPGVGVALLTLALAILPPTPPPRGG